MSSFTSYCKGKRIPIIGNFELTRKCPFNCVICYNERKSKRELTTAEICGILDQLAEQGCIHINFTGGDPLIRDDFPQIYQYAVNLGIVPSIESELAYFPPSVKDILRTYPPHEINVSLYAIDDNVFQEVTRTSLSAKTVLNNLIDLRELGIYFRVRTPVTKINIGQAGKIARFCRTLGIEYNASTKIFWKQSGDRIDSVRCTPNCIKESSDGDPIYDYLYSITKDLWPKPIVKHSCDTGITDFNISAYGELNFCITFWKPEYNLLNGSFQDAWDNWYPLFRRIEGDYCLGKALFGNGTTCPWGRLYSDTSIDTTKSLLEHANERICIYQNEGMSVSDICKELNLTKCAYEAIIHSQKEHTTDKVPPL